MSARAPAEPGVPAAALGDALHALVARLFPFCRSITGDGVRRTLAVVREHVPLEVHEVPSGTPVLDWTVPQEWSVREAWIRDPGGRTVVDFAHSNLHLVGYSRPVRARMPLAALRPHLFTLPDRPRWVPYRTTYYADTWGFCLAHEALERLPEGEYEVCVDTTLADGSLTYGELFLPGTTGAEVLVSCHVCHPSLANDNLSGIAVATFLAARVAARPARRHGYRFLFVPGTIGSITWLARNRDRVGRIAHGLVLTCAGDPGAVTYKRSRRGAATIDRAVAHVLAHGGRPHRLVDFSPWGYDERQYCSPGFDLPVGCLMRSEHGTFPEYHTSADDLAFVRPEALADTLATCEAVVDVLEGDERLVNTHPFGEPQLGRRGLYRAIGGGAIDRSRELAMLWVLNLADGSRTLLDVAERSGLPFAVVRQAADVLAAHGLLAPSPAAEAEPCG